MPMPAAQAAAEPDIAAMMMLAAMAAFESPPQRCPRHTRPKPKRSREIPPTLMRLPMRRKNGIDISVMPETCANILCGTRKSREKSPPAQRKVAMEANAIVTAVVTPMNMSRSTATNMTSIVMGQKSIFELVAAVTRTA